MVEEQLTIEAQEAVNELWAEQAIPFKLTAHKVEAGEPGHYTVHFFDAQLRSLFIFGTLRRSRLRPPFERWGRVPSGKGHELRAPARAWQVSSRLLKK